MLEQIPWYELTAVGIWTTSDGPWAEDLFWQFLVNDRLIELPGELVDGGALEEIRERLPGLDWRKVGTAYRSTGARCYGIWDHEVPAVASTSLLLARFTALVTRLGGEPTAAAQIGTEVLESWGEHGRRYHDVGHLVACLHELDGLQAVEGRWAALADRIELALWYHDVVYEPGAADCEARSAQRLVRDALVLELGLGVVDAASALVMATAHGGDAKRDLAADLIVDIDLSILGANSLRFMDYEFSIEEEYAAIPTRRFRRARGRFLAGLLARPRLFRTERFLTRYEARARAQLAELLSGARYRRCRWLRWLPG